MGRDFSVGGGISVGCVVLNVVLAYGDGDI